MSFYRKTTQALVPAYHTPPPLGQYDLYPGFPLGSGKIGLGYATMAQKLSAQRQVTLDGYGGVLWTNFKTRLNAALINLGLQVTWLNIDEALRPEADIDALIAPFLGGDDPLFGCRFTGHLRDFFDPAETPHPSA